MDNGTAEQTDDEPINRRSLIGVQKQFDIDTT